MSVTHPLVPYKAPDYIRRLFHDQSTANLIFERLGFNETHRLSEFYRVMLSLDSVCNKAKETGGVFQSDEFIRLSELISKLRIEIEAIDTSVKPLAHLDEDGNFFNNEFPILRFLTAPNESELHARLVGFFLYALLKTQREDRLGDFKTASKMLRFTAADDSNKKTSLKSADQDTISGLFDQSENIIELRDLILTEQGITERKQSNVLDENDQEYKDLNTLKIALRHLKNISEHILFRSAREIVSQKEDLSICWNIESRPIQLNPRKVNTDKKSFFSIEDLSSNSKSTTVAIEVNDVLNEIEVMGGERLLPGEQNAKENQAASISRRWMDRTSALLPFNKELFDEEEREGLFEEISKALASDVRERKIAAVLIQLSMCLARPPDELASIIVGEDIHPDGYYKKKVVEHEEAVQIEQSEKEKYFKKTEYLNLYLPSKLIKAFVELGLNESIKNPQTLTKFLGISVVEAKHLVKDLLSRVRLDGSDRVIFNNIHTQVRNTFAVDTQDLCSSFLLFNKPTEGAPIHLFYRAISAYQLEKSYLMRVKTYFNDDLEIEIDAARKEVYAGSNLILRSDVFRKELEQLKSIISTIPVNGSLTEFVEFHNLYTAYTLLALNYATGHRPTSDPFCYVEELDIKNGICIINDKNTIELHKNRISFFPATVKSQIENYIEHIEALGQSIYKQDKVSGIPHFIESLLEENITKEKQAIPFLFYLSGSGKYLEVSPASTRNILGELMAYKDNQQRHYIETTLHELGANPRAIDHQMGHIIDGVHHLRNTHTWSIKKLKEHIEPYIQTGLDKLGFEALKGMKCPEHKFSIQPYYRKDGGKKEFGPEARSRVRRERILIIRDVLQEILEKHTKKNGKMKNGQAKPRQLDQAIQEIIRNEINEVFIDDPAAKKKADLIFTRYCSYSNYVNGVTSYAKYKTFHFEEQNPVSNDWLLKFRVANKISDTLVKYFSENSKTEVDVNLRWAEIVVSSIICGSLFRETWAKKLIELRPSDLYRISDKIFFDIHIEENSGFPEWRYPPDPQTLMLIHGLRQHEKSKDDKKVKYSNDEIEENIYKLCKRIGVPGRGKHEVFSNLCEISESYNFFNLPAYIHAVIKGDLSYTPLSIETYIRMMSDKKIKTANQASIATDYVEITPYTKIGNERLACYEDREAYKLINRIFSEASSYKSKYTEEYKKKNALIKASQTHEMKNSQKKERDNLKHKIRRGKLKFLAYNLRFLAGIGKENPNDVLINLKIDKNKKLSNNSRKVCEWLIDFCESRLRQTVGIPKVSTPLRYFSCLKPIFYNSYPDIQYMEDYELLDTYQDIIDQVNDKKKPYRIKQLKSFHNFLMRYGANPMPWSFLEGVNWSERNIANANLVTESEYIDIINVISKSNFTEYEKTWISGVIIIGYRFGFRISEALNLRYSDLHICKNDCVTVYMRNHGDDIEKTSNAVRKVISVDLKENEVTILQKLKLRLEGVMAIDKKLQRTGNSTYIFSNEKIIKEHIDRKKVTDIVTSILRQVCCDPRLTFHHLRHSLANELFRKLLIENNAEYLRLFLRNKEFDYRHLNAVSRMLGHGSPSTTLGNYIHTIEEHLRLIHIDNINQSIDLNALVYIRQESESQIKRTNREKRIKNSELYKNLKSNVYFKNFEHTLKVEGKLKFEEWDGSLLIDLECKISELTLWDLDRLSRIYAIQQKAENLGKIFNLPESYIDQLLEWCRESECETRFEIFAFSKFRRKTWKQKALTPQYSGFNQEISKLKELYENIIDKTKQLDEEQYHLVLQGLVSWANAHRIRSSDSALFFPDSESLISFFKLMDFLGIPREDFYAVLPSGEGERKDYIDILTDLDLEFTPGHIFQGLSVNAEEPKLRVALRKKTGILNHQASLNRVLFMLTMWTKVRKAWSSTNESYFYTIRELKLIHN